MKKIFVIAVFLVVIGVLCTVFVLRGNRTEADSDEKPWTVGDRAESTTQAESTTEAEADAVSAFSAFIHTDLREDYTFLSTQEPADAAQTENALLGAYMYDVDTDDQEELCIVRASDGVTLDIYEYKNGRVQYAASQKLELDTMNDVSLSLPDASMRHVQARLTIYPSGADRYLCLTAEQQSVDGEYNAYTIVMEYAKEKLSVRKSYRLRQSADVVTLMCTDSVTLLYRQASGQPQEDSAVTLSKYSDLDTAFKTEFAKLGLAAPQVTAQNGTLTQYKVTPVKSEQVVFDVTVDGGTVQMTENGFLQSFILRK